MFSPSLEKAEIALCNAKTNDNSHSSSLDAFKVDEMHIVFDHG
jgi:hypothetical protein